MDRLTFDCRWYDDFYQPDHAQCVAGYQKYIVGVSFLFSVQVTLLLHTILFTEIERKRVTEDQITLSGGTSTGIPGAGNVGAGTNMPLRAMNANNAVAR